VWQGEKNMTKMTKEQMMSRFLSATEEEMERLEIAFNGGTPTPQYTALLTCSEVARRLGRDRKTVHMMVNEGKFKTVTLTGRRRKITEQSFYDFLNSANTDKYDPKKKN
jgi:excisionase family DNA binding protein